MVDIPLQPTTYLSPLTGGVHITEATGASLDHTTWAKSVATLPSNNYQNSAFLLVGGCLSSFRRGWLEENCSNNVLNINQQTNSSQTTPVHLKLQIPSKRSSSGLLYPNSPGKEHNKIVRALGFYTHLFLVLKPHQKWAQS